MNKDYLVYETVNVLNNMTYVGVHKTSEMNDDYLGSGKYLWNAINKYGYDNFRKNIIHINLTKDEAYELEKSIVNQEFVDRPDTYNLTIGGKGSFHHLIDRDNTGTNNNFYGHHHSEETKRIHGERMSSMYKGEGNPMYGVTKSKEWRENHSKKVRGQVRTKEQVQRMKDGHTEETKNYGKKNVRFIGYWITPVGRFSNSRDAANSVNISQGSLRNYCKNDCEISLGTIKNSDYLSKLLDLLGKTSKEVGFDFEECIK